MASKKKYLTYLEDTKKHHSIIEKVAKSSAQKAITDSHERSVPVTFLEGEEIIKVGPKGGKTVLGIVRNSRRKVKVGAKTTISKK